MNILDKIKLAANLGNVENLPAISGNDLNSYLDLKVEGINAFMIDGRVFIGEYTNLFKRYCSDSPSKKFLIWLIDNNLELS